MKKKLSPRELVLLVFLGIIVIGVCYYKFFYAPITEKISALESEKSLEQSLVDGYQITANKMDIMQEVVDEIKVGENANPIPQYNNSTKLMKVLYSILSDANSYSLSFGSVSSTDGSYIVDRPVDVSFETYGYETAREILNEIEGCEYVNQISSVGIIYPSYSDGETVWNVFNYTGDNWNSWDPVTVSFDVTFYELLN